MNNQNQQQLTYTQAYLIEAEKAVLGAILIEKEAFERVSAILTSDMFYHGKYGELFATIVEMNASQILVDMITVVEHLRSKGTLELIGLMTIAELTESIASSVHIEQHAMIIKQKYIARSTMLIAQQAINSIVNNEDVSDVLRISQNALSSLEDGMVNTSHLKPLSKYLTDSIRDMYQRASDRRKGISNGITTGLKDLDKVTNGWKKGDLVVIAARPAVGKTAFSLKFAKSAAQSEKSVAIFSLEMTGISLADRLILSESSIETDRFRGGYLSNEELASFENSANSLFRLPIYIDDSSTTTISRIKSKSRTLKKKDKCDLIIIDYLQLADGDDKYGNREQEIASISRGAKKIAKDLDVPVILLSQLSRAVEGRTSKRPLLSDLRESGAIEQDADMVCFLYREDYYKDASGNRLMMVDNSGRNVENGIEFIISKFRNGATGSIIVQHDGTLNNIFDYNPNPF